MTKGLDVVRMNFSHGTHEYHSTVIKNAREAAKKVNKYVAIALDTKAKTLGRRIEVVADRGTRERRNPAENLIRN